MNQKMMNKKDLNVTVSEIQRLRSKRADGAERLVQEYFVRQEAKMKMRRASTASRRPSISISFPGEQVATPIRKLSELLCFAGEREAEDSDDETMSKSSSVSKQSESKQSDGNSLDVNPYVVKFKMGVSAVQSKMKAHNMKYLLTEGLQKYREDPLQERLNRRKLNAQRS
jgi:hypothetical protein